MSPLQLELMVLSERHETALHDTARRCQRTSARQQARGIT